MGLHHVGGSGWPFHKSNGRRSRKEWGGKIGLGDVRTETVSLCGGLGEA